MVEYQFDLGPISFLSVGKFVDSVKEIFHKSGVSNAAEQTHTMKLDYRWTITYIGVMENQASGSSHYSISTSYARHIAFNPTR